MDLTESAVQLLPYTASWEAKNCALMLIHHPGATVGSQSPKGKCLHLPSHASSHSLEEWGTSGVMLLCCQTPSPRKAAQALSSAANV